MSAPRVGVHRRDVLLLLLALLVMVVANAAWAERLRVNEGLGWDGMRYADVVRDPRSAVLERTTDSYTMQRVLPAVAVRGLLVIARAEPSNANIVRGFVAFNAMLVLLSGALWGMIAIARGVSRAAFITGAVALFVNYAVVKQLSYYAAMTDTSALALGMAVVLFHTRRSIAGLALCAVIAAFTWQVALVLILPLILWPRGTGVPAHDRVTGLGILVAGAVTLGLLASFAFVFIALDRRAVGYGPVVPVVSWLLPLSLPAFAAAWFFGLRTLLRGADVQYALSLLRELTIRRTLLGIGLLVGVQLAVRALASPTRVPVIPITTFFAIMAFTPMTRPLVTLVAHVTYFGPWVLLLLALWPHVAAIARAEGAGMIALVAGGVILGVLPESRQSSFVVPMFVLLTVMAADAVAIPATIHVLIAAAAVVMSKFWLRIGQGELFTELRMYFMNHGPYMNDREYVVHAIVVLALGVAVVVMLRARGLLRWSPSNGGAERRAAGGE